MELRTWFNLLRAAAHREEGQTMAEYGVVLALITLAVVTVLGLLRTTRWPAARRSLGSSSVST